MHYSILSVKETYISLLIHTSKQRKDINLKKTRKHVSNNKYLHCTIICEVRKD